MSMWRLWWRGALLLSRSSMYPILSVRPRMRCSRTNSGMVPSSAMIVVIAPATPPVPSGTYFANQATPPTI
eukprot:1827426-Amphidinium_carterae.1